MTNVPPITPQNSNVPNTQEPLQKRIKLNEEKIQQIQNCTALLKRVVEEDPFVKEQFNTLYVLTSQGEADIEIVQAILNIITIYGQDKKAVGQRIFTLCEHSKVKFPNSILFEALLKHVAYGLEALHKKHDSLDIIPDLQMIETIAKKIKAGIDAEKIKKSLENTSIHQWHLYEEMGKVNEKIGGPALDRMHKFFEKTNISLYFQAKIFREIVGAPVEEIDNILEMIANLIKLNCLDEDYVEKLIPILSKIPALDRHNILKCLMDNTESYRAVYPNIRLNFPSLFSTLARFNISEREEILKHALNTLGIKNLHIAVHVVSITKTEFRTECVKRCKILFDKWGIYTYDLFGFSLLAEVSFQTAHLQTEQDFKNVLEHVLPFRTRIRQSSNIRYHYNLQDPVEAALIRLFSETPLDQRGLLGQQLKLVDIDLICKYLPKMTQLIGYTQKDDFSKLPFVFKLAPYIDFKNNPLDFDSYTKLTSFPEDFCLEIAQASEGLFFKEGFIDTKLTRIWELCFKVERPHRILLITQIRDLFSKVATEKRYSPPQIWQEAIKTYSKINPERWGQFTRYICAAAKKVQRDNNITYTINFSDCLTMVQTFDEDFIAVLITVYENGTIDSLDPKVKYKLLNDLSLLYPNHRNLSVGIFNNLAPSIFPGYIGDNSTDLLLKAFETFLLTDREIYFTKLSSVITGETPGFVYVRILDLMWRDCENDVLNIFAEAFKAGLKETQNNKGDLNKIKEEYTAITKLFGLMPFEMKQKCLHYLAKNKETLNTGIVSGSKLILDLRYNGILDRHALYQYWSELLEKDPDHQLLDWTEIHSKWLRPSQYDTPVIRAWILKRIQEFELLNYMPEEMAQKSIHCLLDRYKDNPDRFWSILELGDHFQERIMIVLKHHKVLDQDVLFEHWSQIMQKNPDKKIAGHVVEMILENGPEWFGLTELDEICQQAIRTHILLNNLEDPLNPYVLFDKLLQKRTEMIDWKILTPKIEIVENNRVSFNLDYIKQNLKQLVIYFKDAPKFSPTFLQDNLNAVKKQLDQDPDMRNSLTNQGINLNFFDLNIQFPGRQRLENHLTKTGNPQDKINFVTARFMAIAAYIESLKEDKEKKFLSMICQIQNCVSGQSEGINGYYLSMLPSEFKYSELDTNHKKEKELGYQRSQDQITNMLSEEIEKMFSGQNDLMKDIVGIKSLDEVMQSSHQAGYLRNLIGFDLGLSDELVFDAHTNLLYVKLINSSKQEIMQKFFDHFSPKAFVNLIANTFLEEDNEDAITHLTKMRILTVHKGLF